MLASELRRAAGAAEPRTLAGYVRWVRWAYAQEPPTRLHTRETGPDGLPRWSGDFYRWLQGTDQSAAACSVDEDGYFRTPFRCAIYAFHGRWEENDRARMADYALSIAASDEPLEAVAARHALVPWAIDIVTQEVLHRLWQMYAPMPPTR